MTGRLGDARLSLVLGQAFPDVPEQAVPDVVVRSAEEYGFQVFEVVPASDAGLRARVAGAAGGGDIIYLAGIPMLRAGATLIGDTGQRARGVAVVRAIIEQAGETGAEAVMVTSGRPDGSTPTPELLRRLVASLTELAAVAAEHGLRLRLEPTDTDLHHRQFVGPTALAVQIADRVSMAGGAIDLNLDLSHMLQLGEVPRNSLALAAAHCRHVHLANVALTAGHPLRGDRHPPFGYPGTEVDVAELAATIGDLRATGYLDGGGVIGLEVIPLAGDDPWTTLRSAVAALDTALATEW